MRVHEIIVSLSRAIGWHRRALAALAAAACVLCLAQVLRPSPPETVDVVVAVRSLPAGAKVSAADLTTRSVPVELAPDEAIGSPDEVGGRVLLAGLPRGAIVTRAAVLHPDGRAGEGEMVVPVSVADRSMLSMVRVGDLVTVVTAGQAGKPVVLAKRVRVAMVPTDDGPGTGGMVLVATDATTAATLAAWSSTQPLGIALG